MTSADRRRRGRSRSSLALHRLGEVTSRPATGLLVLAAVVPWLAVGVGEGFPLWWVNGFEVAGTAGTLVMVFAIQHTQGRQVAGLQRKLDELLVAAPHADSRAIGVEHAADGELEELGEAQRRARDGSDRA